MSEKFLTDAQRLKLPADDFGDPVRRLFPILSQEDLDKAPSRINVLENSDEVRARLMDIAKKKGFTIPTKWDATLSEFSENDKSDSEGVAEFELDPTTATSTNDGNYVLRTGKIFESGQYKDKDFEISPEELCEAINAFKPVGIDMEHMPTIMDGKLGTLEAVALDADGRSLIGTVKVPKWLDENVLKDDPRKVSATWDRNSKRLMKLALVRNPRVKDAALLSENAEIFASFMMNEHLEDLKNVSKEDLVETIKGLMENEADFKSTWDGKSVMQGIHDMSSRSGAVCSESQSKFDDWETAGFVSASEAKAIQQIHDTSCKGGAKCSFMKDRTSDSVSSEYKDNEIDKENIIMLKELKNFFLTLPDDASLEDVKEKIELNTQEKRLAELAQREEAVATAEKALAEKEAALAATEKEEVEEKTEEVIETVENSNEPSDREKELEKQIEELRLKDVVREAEKFADSEIKAERAYPAERPMMIALFTKASQADESGDAKVKFNNGTEEVESTNVELLKSMFAVRKPHNFTYEDVEDLTLNILETDFSKDENDSVLPDAVKQAKEFAARKNKSVAR